MFNSNFIINSLKDIHYLMCDHYIKVDKEATLLPTTAPQKRFFDKKTLVMGALALAGVCGVAYGH